MKDKKNKIWVTVVILLLAFVFSYGYVYINGQGESLERFDTTVSVSDGVANIRFQEKELQVSEEGTYRFQLNCKPDEKGLLSGFVLMNEKTDVLFACTGEELTVESEELELQEGNYTIQFHYFTNEEDWNALVERIDKQIDMERIGEQEYVFAENGKWNIQYEYGLVESENVSVGYILGMICGIAFGLFLVAVLMWLVKKMGGKVAWGCKKDSYDERQLLARGEAYKVAFFTMICYVVVVSLMNEFFEIPIFMSFGGMWVGVSLSILVFATICIWKDAYMSLYENARGVILLFSFIGILNVVCGMPVILGKSKILENGVISANCINLIVGILFCLILIVFVGKLLYNEKHSDDEDEE